MFNPDPSMRVTSRFYQILNCFLIFILTCTDLSAQEPAMSKQGDFKIRIIADKLSDPWEISYGPDAQLWVTESKNYKVWRIDPATGKRQQLLDLSEEREFPRYDQVPDEQDGGKPWPQGGLMGMALHPDLLRGKPYVYLAYTYRFKGAAAKGDGAEPGLKGYHFVGRVVRYTYDQKRQQLHSPLSLCDTIPASSDHNGGRLLIAPVQGKNYLYYSIGDMGAGQFANGGRQNKAQDRNSYEGKVLRFNAEPDGDKDPFDRWIPNDNPFNAVAQNAVWSLGHRNPQGLAYGELNGKTLLYSVEHGPYGDDELNLLEAGGNYGHPLIIGRNDGNYDGLAASVSDHAELPGKWHTSYPLIPSEAANAKALGASYKDPERSFYAIPHKQLQALFGKIAKGDEQEWEAYGPSSLAMYTSDGIPGWKNSLLITTLKGSALLRLKLDRAGKVMDGEPEVYVKGKVRYRDLAISSDGKKIYLSADNSAVSSGPSEQHTEEVSYKGCILELTYQ
jgi:PQQ-dependent dehydrogenase (s-GDH family)